MKAKKHFGQNFLKSEKIVERMVTASEATSKDTILEIGPGKGILTKALLETGAHVITIEKDTDLIPLLNEKFINEIKEGKLKIVSADVLTLDISKMITGTYKLVANIPYYITGEIIRQFLTIQNQPSLMTLLVQKEVAKRIVASDKKESILSLSVKIFGEPTITEIVKKTMFTPSPKVDSAVIVIKNIGRSKLKSVSESDFFTTIKCGFSQKRKQLLSNTKKLEISNKIKTYLEANDIPITVRAEDLKLQHWLDILKK